MMDSERISVPAWLVVLYMVILLAGIGLCWWLSVSTAKEKAFAAGREIEIRQNPARQYIEDGVPFLWYKGTYYRVKYIGPKTFKTLD